MAEEPPADSLREARAVGDVDLEGAPASADQVVADVRRLVGDPRVLGGLTGAFDGAQSDAHLCLAGRLRQLLHRVPIAVTAGKVHPRIDPGRIPPQDLLHRADPLHEAAPVEGRAEPEAGHRVAGGDLVGRLALAFAANLLLGRRPASGQRPLHRRREGGNEGVVLAHPRPELGHEGARDRLGQRAGRRPELQSREGAIRLPARRAPGAEAVGQDPQVLEQRDLEHAGQSPELADRQRRHGLEGEDEAGEPIDVEPPVAVLDEIGRQRMDAGLAGALTRRELGQRPVVLCGQVALHRARLRLDEVEVVEQPLGGGGYGDSPVDVVGEVAVRRLESPEVTLQTSLDAGPDLPCRGRRSEQGGERLGSLLEAFEAQQLAPQRRGVVGSAPWEQGSPRYRKIRSPSAPPSD